MTLEADVLLDEQLVLGADVAADGALLWTVRRPAHHARGYAVELWQQPADGTTPQPVPTRTAVAGAPRFDASGTAAVVLGAGEPGQAWRIALDGSGETALTALPHGALQVVPSPASPTLAALAPWGEPDLLVGDPRSPTARHVRDLRVASDGFGFRDRRWRLLLIDGDAVRPLGAADADVEACGWSPDGASLWYAARGDDPAILGASRLWVVGSHAGATPRLLADEAGTIVDAAWSADGRIAYATHPGGDSTAAQLFVVDASGGTPRRIDGGLCVEQVALLDTLPIAGADIGQLCWDPSGDAVLALVTHRSRVRVHAFPVRDPAAAPAPLAGELTAGALRARGAHVALVGSAGRAAADVHRLVDGQARRVSAHGDWLAREHWPAGRSIQVSARGRSVHAWLFEPVGADGPLPLVLHVHGGPHQSHIELAWLEIVLLTARGHRVLCPDPTGSLGYGDAFSTGVHDAHREHDLDDLVACVDHALDHALADPERIAVMGMSYGGAATLRMLAAEPRLAAGIAENPYANLVSFLGTSDIAAAGDELLGFAADEPDLTRWLARSPIAGVERIHAPLLLLGAEHDLRCPIGESEQVFTRLRALGRTVELVRFPEESHLMFHVGRPDRRRHRLQVILDWLATHLHT